MLYFLVKTSAGGIEETYEKRTLCLCLDYTSSVVNTNCLSDVFSQIRSRFVIFVERLFRKTDLDRNFSVFTFGEVLYKDHLN